MNADYQPLKAPILGHSIVRYGDLDAYGVLYGDAVISRGSLEYCEEALAKSLLNKYGTGKLNLEIKTLGGLQLWADKYWYSNWKIQEHVYAGYFRLLNPQNVRKAWGTWEECRTALEQFRVDQHIPDPKDHLVVLLHGLGRANSSFKSMAEQLEQAGFATARLVYPSTRRSLNEHAQQLHDVLNRLDGIEHVSFVTHSLGGMVVRKLLATNGGWENKIKLSRVLMLAPPSQGSKVADVLRDFLPFTKLAGPSGQELSAIYQEQISLPKPPCEFAIIAGGKGNGSGWNPLLDGDDDGVLTVEECRLDGASGFKVVPHIHTFIMSAPDVIKLTTNFLLGKGLN